MKAHAVFLGLWLFPVSLMAADTKDIKYKSRDLEKIRMELHNKKEEKERLEREAANLVKEVRDGEAKIENLKKSLINTKNRTFQVGQELARTKVERDRMLENVMSNRHAIERSATQYQVASLISSAESPRPVYLKQVIHSRIKDHQELRKKSNESTQAYHEMVNTQETLHSELTKQESRLNSLRTGREDKKRLLDKKKTRQEILAEEMAELHRTAKELESLIEDLRSKAQKEKATEKRARVEKQLSGHSPILRRSLPWPLKGSVKVPFGRNASAGATLISNGITIESSNSQSMIAVGDGKVLYAGNFMSYGSMVVVEHAGDWYSVYGQLLRWNVEKGQQVKKGDAIGQPQPKGGNYQAYFELRFYGKPTDPLPWLVKE